MSPVAGPSVTPTPRTYRRAADTPRAHADMWPRRRAILHTAIIPLVAVPAPAWPAHYAPLSTTWRGAGGEVRAQRKLPPLITPLISLHAPSWSAHADDQRPANNDQQPTAHSPQSTANAR